MPSVNEPANRERDSQRPISLSQRNENSHTCVAESALATGRRVEVNGLFQCDGSDGGNYELGDPISPPYGEGARTQVYKGDLQFPPIIRIDCAGRVENCQPIIDSESAPRSDLTLVALWYAQRDADWDKCGHRRFNCHRTFHRGCQIEARAVLAHFSGKRQVRVVGKPLYLNNNHLDDLKQDTRLRWKVL